MKKVLVIDDDEEILETIELILQLGGFDVSKLNTPNELFKRIYSYQPHLIIMDISLGKFDGRVLCEQIKNNAHTSKIPILLISALYKQSEFSSLDYGQDDFIAKPFDIKVLLSKIAKILNIPETDYSVN